MRCSRPGGGSYGSGQKSVIPVIIPSATSKKAMPSVVGPSPARHANQTTARRLSPSTTRRQVPVPRVLAVELHVALPTADALSGLRHFVHDVGMEESLELRPVATLQRVDEPSRQLLGPETGRIEAGEEGAQHRVELLRMGQRWDMTGAGDDGQLGAGIFSAR